MLGRLLRWIIPNHLTVKLLSSGAWGLADLIESAETDILLFTHAGMMAYLRSELVRRGFVGPRYRLAEHGRLYVFERP